MTLPNLPEPAMVHMDAQGYSTPCYTSESMQEYALAALRAQPAYRMLSDAEIDAVADMRLKYQIESYTANVVREFARDILKKAGAIEHCQCPACINGVIHDSDCAVHGMPARPNGACNCGAQPNIQNYPEKDISQPDYSELIARLREESVHARFGAFDTMIDAADALEGI